MTYSGAENSGCGPTADSEGGTRAGVIPVLRGLLGGYGQTAGKNVKVDLAGRTIVLSAGGPTCVCLSVAGGALGRAPVHRRVRWVLGAGPCRTKRTGKPSWSLKALVDLRPRPVQRAGNATLDCDKSLCGQGGVTPYIPLFGDIANNGTFVTPAAGVPGQGRDRPAGPVVSLLGPRSAVPASTTGSTRDNAGDLFTYMLFDYDIKAIH